MSQQEKPIDLLLKGGRVIDPANKLDGIADVGITGGKIARVAPSIPVEGARNTVDVSGYLVTPGLKDRSWAACTPMRTS